LRQQRTTANTGLAEGRDVNPIENTHGFGCRKTKPTVSATGDSPFLRVRQTVAWPIYLIALILDYTAAALGCLAARIAGDDWPR
jgi:hypothetical protein